MYLFKTAICAMAVSASGMAFAGNSVSSDPFFAHRVVGLQFGAGTTFNTLDGPLTAANNTSPGAFAGPLAPIAGTGVLDFGVNGRVDAMFSTPLSTTQRLFFEASYSMGSGKAALNPAVPQTFPGSYDDGFLLPVGFSYRMKVRTESFLVKAGKEWATSEHLRFRAGVQAGSVSQDFTARLVNGGGGFDRRLHTSSHNRLAGVTLGASYYQSFNSSLGLRLAADVGLNRNRFKYNYTNINSGGALDQSNRASDTLFSASSKVTATLEKTLSNRTLLTFQAGLENFHNVGNGVETFLNPQGTATTAVISKNTISSVFLSVGFSRLF